MQWTDLTRRQGGLIARRQFVALGITASIIDALLRNGQLESTLSAGVYRAAGSPRTPETPAWYAVLATNSPLSYISAAPWWGMNVPQDGFVHITRLDRRRLDWPPGIRVHRVGLNSADVTTRYGIGLTTRVETALDCMGWLPYPTARAFADRAVQQGWIAPHHVVARLESQGGRWGNRQLRRLLAGLTDGAHAESERILHRLLRQAGITGWQPNQTLEFAGKKYEVDVVFPALGLIIEIDGFRYHNEDDRFQGDRTKQNRLVRTRWTVLRFTWADLHERPEQVISEIREMLQLLAA